MTRPDKLSKTDILNLKVKDLSLDFNKDQKAIIKVFYARLKEKNINWRPHIWASDEWFSPDGIGGIAVPFILLHPRLIKLEKEFLGECEGKKKKEFFKLLCHEAGHAIDNAFKLRLKKKRQNIFGLSSKRYPSSYRPKIHTTEFVNFLGDHYAQAHPDEDWAETFGVWLSTDNWMQSYKRTAALEKLKYIDQVMKELAFQAPKNTKRNTYLSYKNDKRTVKQYLMQKQKSLNKNRKNFYTDKLSPIFTNEVNTSKAVSYLNKNKFRILLDLQSKTNEDIWNLTRSYEELKQECKKNKYALKFNEQATEIKIKQLLQSTINDYKKAGNTRIYM